MTVWSDSFYFRAGQVGDAHENRKQCRWLDCGCCRSDGFRLHANVRRAKVCSMD